MRSSASKLADALLVWGQWQTDAWLTVEFGFVLGDPTADGGFQVQFVTELGDAVLLLNDFLATSSLNSGGEVATGFCGMFDVLGGGLFHLSGCSKD